MDQADFTSLATYVTFMKEDIGREVALYRSGHPAGQLLCALGLVVYTEVLGRIHRWNDDRPRFYSGRRGVEELYLHFNAFFDALSDEHAAWRKAWESGHPTTDLYEALRSGLVHEYAPKVNAQFRMKGRWPLGIGEESGVLVFEVEGYLNAFAAAANTLLQRLMLDPSSSLPPVRYRRDQSADKPVAPS
jgi:hypothetical protein